MSERLRVGILLNALTVSEGIAAGGTQRTLRIVREWRDRFDCVIFAPAFARPALQRDLPWVEIVSSAGREPAGRIGAYLWRVLYALRLRARLRACDVLYASSPFVPDSALLAIASGVPSAVLIAHLLPHPKDRPGSRLWNAVASAAEYLGLALVRRFAGTIVALSDGLRSQLRARGMRQPIVLGTSGLDHIATSQGRRCVVDAVCVARLHPAKGISDLVEAWSFVVAARPEAALTIVGDGEPPYVARLRGEIARAGLDARISLECGADDVRRDALLGAARIFAFASHEEGWGIALGEAMAAGLPCVTYDLPVFREVFPRGRVAVALGDTRAFADAVIALLADDARREQLAAQAAEDARTFTWARAAEIDGRCVAALAGSDYGGKSE